MMDEELYREMIMYYIVEDDGWRAVQRNDYVLYCNLLYCIVEDDGWRAVQRNDWRTWERGSRKSPAPAWFKGKPNRGLYFPKNYYPPPFF